MSKFTISLLICGLMSLLMRAQDHDEHQDIVHLDGRKMSGLNLSVARVQSGNFNELCELPATIKFIPQKVVHLTPRVPGLVGSVYVKQGDWVSKGQVLAILESQALGTAKSSYLSAVARQNLYEKTFIREKQLWERKISPEQDFLEAENRWEESRIEVNERRQALLVFGLTKKEIAHVADAQDHELIQYTFKAPFSGVVTDAHITKGEFLNVESTAFVIVDPSQVWVVGQVFEKDLHRVDVGQKVIVSVDAYPDRIVEGTIDYVSAALNNETRSAETRVVIQNENGLFKSEMFARLTLFVDHTNQSDGLLLPVAGIQRTESGPVVFKQVGEDEYQQIPIVIVKKGKDLAEVKGPLTTADSIAVGDVFILRSELQKSEMSESHSH